MSEEDKYLYIDDQLHIVTGDEAARAIREKSDERFLDKQKGVVRVTRDRWTEAQRYERDTWLVAAAEASDDRNADHVKGFNGYAALRGRTFRHAVELGCGPFTNLRLIAEHCSVAQCTLVDPLVLQYLEHRHCTYDTRFLRCGKTNLGLSLTGSRAGRLFSRLLGAVAPDLLQHRLPVVELVPTPIEEMPTTRRYDLIVMINVLEHCYDAERIFDVIAEILETDGVFVFHDKLFDQGEIERDVRTRFDAGHPLRVERNVVESFLGAHFEPLYRWSGPVADGYEDIDLSRDSVYFIGTRKG